MRIDRFYISQSIEGDTVTVTEDRLLHQWRSVLRAKPGFKVVLFDGSGSEFEAVVKSIDPDKAMVEVTGQILKQPIEPAIWLYAGLIKRDKFEWIIEKTTEIGVAGIIPLLSDRSDKKNLVRERAERIMIEAAEQSGRVDIPKLGAIQTVEEALDEIDPFEAVVCDRGGEGLERDPRLGRGQRRFFIGPEGGWSDRERELFKEKNIPALSLSRQNLKTETAAVSLVAVTLLSTGATQ